MEGEKVVMGDPPVPLTGKTLPPLQEMMGGGPGANRSLEFSITINRCEHLLTAKCLCNFRSRFS